MIQYTALFFFSLSLSAHCTQSQRHRETGAEIPRGSHMTHPIMHASMRCMMR
jgi:hypothetical protein